MQVIVSICSNVTDAQAYIITNTCVLYCSIKLANDNNHRGRVKSESLSEANNENKSDVKMSINSLGPIADVSIMVSPKAWEFIWGV